MNEENEVIIEPKAEDEVIQGSEPGPDTLPDNLPVDEKPSSSSSSSAQGYFNDYDD
jgi:hypothetical protein